MIFFHLWLGHCQLSPFPQAAWRRGKGPIHASTSYGARHEICVRPYPIILSSRAQKIRAISRLSLPPSVPLPFFAHLPPFPLKKRAMRRTRCDARLRGGFEEGSKSFADCRLSSFLGMEEPLRYPFDSRWLGRSPCSLLLSPFLIFRRTHVRGQFDKQFNFIAFADRNKIFHVGRPVHRSVRRERASNEVHYQTQECVIERAKERGYDRVERVTTRPNSPERDWGFT